MTIKQKGQVIFLEEVVGVEDAETLYTMLGNTGIKKINAGSCEHMHSAVLQLIIGFHLKMTKYPENAALAQWLKNSSLVSHTADATHSQHEVNNG
uniref:hypothetical protein n=1 Tax=Cellvibrio fontiphilus TaxID=1815559 RepID=UPI002B4BC646|nr:hypothetical protein [Cellvibrio fontiphilus]